MADHQPAERRPVADNGNDSNHPKVDSAADSDRDSVTSELSTQGYTVSLKDDLLKALNNIKAPGTFASFRKLPDTLPAGLHVDGVGDISMPLNETQARQLIAKARQAPYGKGGETIVDTSVRNTWELDASQFTFKDRKWPAFVHGLYSSVAQDLGIKSPIRAELYKMLIYERGAMFKGHTDTEKIPGMFGTLVISLPSAHQGGDVVVKHCGQTKIFKTSDHTSSVICWYSDVHHEVCPVESGYRWVLTYNLALDPNAVRPSAGLLRSETKDLRHTLRKWLQEPVESRRNGFYYVLDHDYTEASVKLNSLKGRDLSVGQVLNGLSQELNFEVFFAFLEKEEWGGTADDEEEMERAERGWWYYDDEWDEEEEDSEAEEEREKKEKEDAPEKTFHPIIDICDVTDQVNSLRDMFGKPVAGRLPLDAENEILQDDEAAFKKADPEEEYSGYTGNEVSASLRGSLKAADLILIFSIYATGHVSKALVPNHCKHSIKFIDASRIHPFGMSPYLTARFLRLFSLCQQPRPFRSLPRMVRTIRRALSGP